MYHKEIKLCLIGIFLTGVLAIAGIASFAIIGMMYYSHPLWSETWFQTLLTFGLFGPAEISFAYFFLKIFRPGSRKLTVALAVVGIHACFILINLVGELG